MKENCFKSCFCSKEGCEKEISNKIIAELVGAARRASSTQAVKKLLALKTLKRVQGLSNFITGNGFTLIELLVVVLIIGILAAVAVPQYQKAVEKTRFVQAVTSMDALRRACEVYYLANGAYPTNLSQLDIDPNLPKGYALSLYHNASDTYFAIDMYIRRNGHEILEYVHYLQVNGSPSQRKECRVWEDKPVFHQLCQSVAGKTTGTPTTYYTQYDFE